jgi:hypothetical protein
MTTIKKPDQHVLNRALCAGLAKIYIAPCNLDQIGAVGARYYANALASIILISGAKRFTRKPMIPGFSVNLNQGSISPMVTLLNLIIRISRFSSP